MSKRTIWGNFFPRKKIYNVDLFAHWLKKFWVIFEPFWRDHQTDFYVNRCTFWAKKKLGNFFYHFRIMVEKNVWREFQKDILLVHRNTFRIIAFFENCKFLVTFADNGFWHWRKIFRSGLSKLLSTRPEEHFEDKCTFWETLFSFASCRTLNEKVSNFTIMAKCFRKSGHGVSAGLSKLASTLSEEQFEGKFFCRKKIQFADVFGHGFKNFGTSFVPFWQRFSKLTFLWTEVHFEHKGNLRKFFYYFRKLGEKF